MQRGSPDLFQWVLAVAYGGVLSRTELLETKIRELALYCKSKTMERKKKKKMNFKFSKMNCKALCLYCSAPRNKRSRTATEPLPLAPQRRSYAP